MNHSITIVPPQAATASDGGPALAHVLARRVTADGKHVLLWSTGELTWALGYAIRGAARPRSEKGRESALRAGWLVLGDVELYDADELPALIAAARWAADRDGLPGTMRQRLHDVRSRESVPSTLRPVWRVQSTDVRGRWTVRTWTLHALSPWAGYVVWCERGCLSKASRGQYTLCRVDGGPDRGDVTIIDTGFRFHRIADVQAHLLGELEAA